MKSVQPSGIYPLVDCLFLPLWVYICINIMEETKGKWKFFSYFKCYTLNISVWIFCTFSYPEISHKYINARSLLITVRINILRNILVSRQSVYTRVCRIIKRLVSRYSEKWKFLQNLLQFNDPKPTSFT